jgi:hypothetical protein
MSKGTEDCATFTKTVKDVAQAVKTVREFIKAEGGSFNGDETGGSFSFKKAYSTIAGEYTVSGKAVTIKSTVKDGWASCTKFLDELEKNLK